MGGKERREEKRSEIQIMLKKKTLLVVMSRVQYRLKGMPVDHGLNNIEIPGAICEIQASVYSNLENMTHVLLLSEQAILVTLHVHV